MGTFVELFRVLDGWDTDELPERIDIKADETLAWISRLDNEVSIRYEQRVGFYWTWTLNTRQPCCY